MIPERVLFAAPHFPPNRLGGVELATLRAARWLSERNVLVHVICVETLERGRHTGVAVEDDVVERVPVRRLHVTLAPDEDVRLWGAPPVLREPFETLFNEVRPQVLHLRSGYLLGAAPIQAAIRRDIPAVVTLTDFSFLCPTIQLLRTDGSLCHGPEPLECLRCLHGQRRPIRMLERAAPRLMRSAWKTLAAVPGPFDPAGVHRDGARLAARRKELVAALNASAVIEAYTRFAADLHVREGVARDRIIVQSAPPDVAQCDPLDASPPPPGEMHFAYLGQLAPVKGLELLVRAFLHLPDDPRSGSRPYLHIHGQGDGSYVSDLRRLAAVSPRVTFDGRYEHRRVLNLAYASNVVVVTSLWHENVPRVIGEAFAARRPVVAPRVAGITETVTDGINGLLFNRGDVDDLVRVLRRLQTEPDLLPRLTRGIPAPQSFEDYMSSMLAVYRNLAALRLNRSSG